MRQLQKLAVVVGVITISLFGFQDVGGAVATHPDSTAQIGISTPAGSEQALGNIPGGTTCNVATEGCSKAPGESLAGNSQASIGHTSPAATSPDLDVSGMDITAMFIAALALVALGFLVLIFTRRRIVTS